MGHQTYVLLCTETTLSNHPVVLPKSSCDVHLLRSPCFIQQCSFKSKFSFLTGGGGSCVLLHYISPQSKGLFRSAISISSSTSMLTTLTQTNPAIYTRKLLDKVGCDGNSISSPKIMDCLSTKTSESIAKKAYMFVTELVDFAPMTFQPVLDSYSRNPFLPLSPIDSLNQV